eukprot:9503851-Pyramimonas_sp.AAC.2
MEDPYIVDLSLYHQNDLSFTEVILCSDVGVPNDNSDTTNTEILLLEFYDGAFRVYALSHHGIGPFNFKGSKGDLPADFPLFSRQIFAPGIQPSLAKEEWRGHNEPTIVSTPFKDCVFVLRRIRQGKHRDFHRIKPKMGKPIPRTMIDHPLELVDSLFQQAPESQQKTGSDFGVVAQFEQDSIAGDGESGPPRPELPSPVPRDGKCSP